MILTTEPTKDYELIDSGDGEKLERYGSVLLARPDPQALWHKRFSASEWQKAHGIFMREHTRASWKMKMGVPESWQIELGGLRFVISPTAFKHTGVFPEQVSNWTWIAEKIFSRTQAAGASDVSDQYAKKVSVLNLFGYTGGATLAAAKAGADVTHVDGSKSAISWAKDNMQTSGLSDKPIRFMLDDVRKFVAREIKRGKKYDAIIMDPPAFGHGAKKELWKIEKDFPELLSMCRRILSNDPLFVLINGYASGYSAIAYGNNLDELMKDFKGGKVEVGELTIRERGDARGGSHASDTPDVSGRLLPCGIFARWSKK